MKQGLAIGVAFATVVAFIPHKVNAQDYITDDKICAKAVEYSVKYIPEEDGFTLHQARWNIINGDRTDDMQKLLGLAIFEMGQRVSYLYTEEKHGPADEWFPPQIDGMIAACEDAVLEMRHQDLPLESANPDEAW